MSPMQIRNSPMLAVPVLVVGVLLVIVSFLNEDFGLSTALGILLAVLGALMLINPTLRAQVPGGR